MLQRFAGSLLLLASMAFASVSEAAVITPGLARRLEALSPGLDIAVIVRFTQRVEVERVRAGRGTACALITSLRATSRRSQTGIMALLRRRGLADRSIDLWIINGMAVKVPRTVLDEIARLPEVESIEYDEPVMLAEANPLEVGGTMTAEWNIEKIGVPTVWSTYGLDGTGVVIGSMDTGVEVTHQALAGKWRGGSNSWQDFVNGLPSPYDDHGHGTHTTGTMVGGDGPGGFGSDIGIAYGAKFIAAKVLDANNQFSDGSKVFQGAQWMLDPDGNPATDDFPDVINNSWVFFDPTYTGFHSAVEAWRAVGIIPVFAIGNEGPDPGTTRAPGNYDDVIGVGATYPSDAIWSASSRGPAPSGSGFPLDGRKPDLTAPGKAIRSSLPGGTYGIWEGTSMATPHVAGTVALLLQAHPGASYDAVKTALLSSSVDLGAVGYDDAFGYGRLDALGAVCALDMFASLGIPDTVTATSLCDGVGIRWSWTTSDPDGFDVLRDGEVVHHGHSPAERSWLDVPPGAGTVHSYAVRGYNKCRLGELSSLAAGMQVPVGTLTLTASTDRCQGILLEWDWSGSGQSGFVIVRDGDYEGMRLVGPSERSWLDMGCPSGISNYTIDALNACWFELPRTASGARLVAGTGADCLLEAKTDYGTGPRPVSVVIEDLNGDGNPDLAVVNSTKTVSILLGNGDGTFGAKMDYGPGGPWPPGCSSGVIGDLNADGKPDLAVAGMSPDSVSVLLGNGNGTFGGNTDFATGSHPFFVAIGDLNGDGKADLAVANVFSNTVSVLLGNGDGTFGENTAFGTGSLPYSVAIGDLNGDGRPDLVTPNNGDSTVSVLLGNGDGTFGARMDFGTGEYPASVAIGDLNGDGKQDLAVANGFGAAVLLGNGDGTFGENTDFGTGSGSSSLAIGDLNGDAKPDLVLANWGNPESSFGSVSVLFGNSNGTFGAKIDLGTGREPYSVAIGDLNGDGNPDIAVANNYSSTVSVLLNAGTSSIDVAPTLSAPPRPFQLLPSRPNPSRGKSEIRFLLPSACTVDVALFDLVGRKVRSLVAGELSAPGEHAIRWDGRDGSGAPVRNGVYLVQVRAGRDVGVRKLIILR